MGRGLEEHFGEFEFPVEKAPALGDVLGVLDDVGVWCDVGVALERGGDEAAPQRAADLESEVARGPDVGQEPVALGDGAESIVIEVAGFAHIVGCGAVEGLNPRHEAGRRLHRLGKGRVVEHGELIGWVLVALAPALVVQVQLGHADPDQAISAAQVVVEEAERLAVHGSRGPQAELG
ncbi:MAG: hypothetical protein MAG451_02214 [Anaerolineales bacterium]|nr:hypothetical protein [Anaerolineales bacterium]